jgi:K+-transporting ATPase ATPase C chain
VTLLVLTVLLCSVVYPLILWGAAQTPVLRDLAQGDIVTDAAGKAVGARLIAQDFKGDQYFQPRPSAASYKGEASGASNWAASNYLLRDRVARQLGPIVRYASAAEKDGKTPGDLVGPDIEKWFQADRYRSEPGIVAQWAALHSGLAEQWVKDADSALKAQWKIGDKDRESGQSLLMQLGRDAPQLHAELAAILRDLPAAGTAELARALFPLFAKRFPGEWLVVEESGAKDAPPRKKLLRVKESPEIQAIFFDMWRQANPHLALEEVPGDMVTASASGLDPHITLKNAQYQAKYRIATARARLAIALESRKLHQDFDSLDDKARQPFEAQARQRIEERIGKRLEDCLTEAIDALLNSSASAPLSGAVGVPLVNVLEINLALDARVRQLLDSGH